MPAGKSAVSDKLTTYHAKRDFRITREPRGRVKRDREELKFVVQRHQASKLHYDFRLELDGTLKSWAIPKGPSMNPADKRLAVQVEDHPIDYASFEGDIPEHQYGAGKVEIWDSGIWEPEGDAAAGYRDGKIKFHLYGGRLHGGWTLIRTRMPGGGSKQQWLLIKERDEEALSESGVDEEADRAAATPALRAKAKAVEAKAAAPRVAKKTARSQSAATRGAVKAALPKTVNAQLATLVDAPPEGDWVYEIKYDGYRILARIDGDKIKLYTRDGKDWTAKLPKHADALRRLGIKSAWLDGEIVVLNEHGIPSFQLLQNAFDEKSEAQILFFAFDLLYLDGHDLRNAPLHERRARLEALLAKADQNALRYSATLQEPVDKLLESACSLSMEGIIGKLRDSVYSGKRSADWIKLKCRRRQEFVIAGYTDPQGTRKYLGSLLLGVYGEDGQLHYAGRVGTGFNTEVLHKVYRHVKPLRQARSPYAEKVKRTGPMPAHWLKPELVAEISFAEWTKEGLVRQAVFHGLRLDKPAQQVRREEAQHVPPSGAPAARAEPAALQGVTITHPDRVIDAEGGFTKFDLARYYDAVAPRILPFLQNRPVYLLRSPGGLNGKAFFQRHAIRTAIPGITVLDPSVDPEHQPLMVIDNAHALVSAVQMGVIEFHTCDAKADCMDKPDSMVFDLDPDPDLAWEKVAESARLLKQLLQELGLTSFVKTSGGKGLHVVVPLARRHDWKTVTTFSEAVAHHLAKVFPKRFSVKMGEQNRVGKIYIDYLRNQKMASTVAAYSARARAGLGVSVPLAWEELDEISGSATWNIRTLAERLQTQKKDPWQDYWRTRQIISKSMRRALGLSDGDAS